MDRSVLGSSNKKMFQRHGQRLAFDNEDLDFYLLQFLGYVPYEGASIGECLYAASQIDETDPVSWIREWTALAERVRAQAEDALANGHTDRARKHFLRSTIYYRAASVLIPPGNDLRNTWKQMRSCFRSAAVLFHPPIEPVEIRYRNSHLPGYFVPTVGGDDDRPRPTVLMIGGGETFSEEMYFWAGAPGRERGYNTFLVDLPGHIATRFTSLDAIGIARREGIDGLIESSLHSVVDFLVDRPDIDTDRLVTYGISGGGFFALTAAAADDRLQAIAANTPISDLHALIQSEWPTLLGILPRFLLDRLPQLTARFDPMAQIVVKKILWSSGTDSIAEYLDMTKTATVNPRDITVPMLCMAGTNDPEEAIRQTHEVYETLPNERSEKVIFGPETGADAHCQLNNPELAYATAFDWFDETLDYSYHPS